MALLGSCPAGFLACAGLRRWRRETPLHTEQGIPTMAQNKQSQNKLADTQLLLMSAAAQREDGAIELAPNLKGGAADKVAGKLLTQGLIEEIPARRAADLAPRRDQWTLRAAHHQPRPRGHRGR